jgi:hypothetical protein
VNLEDLVGLFQSRLYLPDPYPLVAVAGAAAGNRLDSGQPCWLALVGPPSSGKTELLVPFLALDGFVHSTVASFAGLLTNPKKRRPGTGGVLAQLGARGTLVFTDLSGLFTERGDEESRVLAGLRDVHDGRLTRHTGDDGGRTLEWRGRAGLLAGSTDVVDLHADLINALGPRMLFARMPLSDHRAVIAAAARNVGRLELVRAELAAAVLECFTDLDPSCGAGSLGMLDEARRDVAEFVAVARSAPRRVGARVVLVPAPEVGARLYAGLSQLRRGLDGLGCAPRLAGEVERRVGLDSIPALKRRLIEHLAATSATPPTRVIAEDLGYPNDTVFDALEDLAAYGVARRLDHGDKREDGWALSTWTRQRLEAIGLDVTRLAGTPSFNDEAAAPAVSFDFDLDDADPLDDLDREQGIGPYRPTGSP